MTVSIENNLAYIIYNRCRDLDKTAYYYLDYELSYKDLLRRSSGFSSYLSDMGIGKNDRVLISLYDSPAIPIVFLGALSVGAVPIVINPKLKHKGFYHIVVDSAPKIIVCEKDGLPVLANNDADNPRFPIDCALVIQDIYDLGLIGELHRESYTSYRGLSDCLRNDNTTSIVAVEKSHASFWQYTSGTTGNPKAVQHCADTMVLNTHNYANATIGIDSNDVIYSVAKMFFGYGMGASLFFPLLLGASCVLDPHMPASDIRVAKNISKFKPTFLFGNPSIYQSFLLQRERIKPIIPQSMKCVSAGAPLPASVFHEWQKHFSRIIYDGIGATEMGHVFISNSDSYARAGSTGKPVKGYQIKLDNSGSNKVGVLWVKGPHANLGYWNLPEETAKKFKDGWYITGDLFEEDDEGYFYYRGRIDELFKVNGIWVTPLALESQLIRSYEAAKECALVPVEFDEGVASPVLFISISGKAAESTDSLKKSVSRWIVDNWEPQERPRDIVFVDAMPRNDNGKIVRKWLSENYRAYKTKPLMAEQS